MVLAWYGARWMRKTRAEPARGKYNIPGYRGSTIVARKYPLGLLPDSSLAESLSPPPSTPSHLPRTLMLPEIINVFSSQPVIFNVHAPVCELLVADKTGILYRDLSFSTEPLSGYWSVEHGSPIFQQLWNRFVNTLSCKLRTGFTNMWCVKEIWKFLSTL